MSDERWDNPEPSQGRQDGLLPVARPALNEARPCLDLPAPAGATLLSPIRAIFEIVIIFGVLLLLPAIFRYFWGETPTWLPAFFVKFGIYGRVLILGSLATLTILWFLRQDRQPLRAVGLHFKNMEDEIWTAFWSLGFIFAFNLAIMVVVSIFMPELAAKLTKERSAVMKLFPLISPIWLILMTAFVGFYEELVFRGFLITRLGVLTRNIWVAVFLSSLIFGVSHAYQDNLAMVQITVIGFIFGAMFVVRKSLISPILAHMAFDFINLAFAFAAAKMPIKEIEKMLSQ